MFQNWGLEVQFIQKETSKRGGNHTNYINLHFYNDLKKREKEMLVSEDVKNYKAKVLRMQFFSVKKCDSDESCIS